MKPSLKLMGSLAARGNGVGHSNLSERTLDSSKCPLINLCNYTYSSEECVRWSTFRYPICDWLNILRGRLWSDYQSNWNLLGIQQGKQIQYLFSCLWFAKHIKWFLMWSNKHNAHMWLFFCIRALMWRKWMYLEDCVRLTAGSAGLHILWSPGLQSRIMEPSRPSKPFKGTQIPQSCMLMQQSCCWKEAHRDGWGWEASIVKSASSGSVFVHGSCVSLLSLCQLYAWFCHWGSHML